MYHNIAFEHVPRYIEIIDKLPKGTATEVLKEILKEDWDKGYYYSNMWDTKIMISWKNKFYNITNVKLLNYSY